MSARPTRRLPHDPKALERYIRGADPPRWMTRLTEIDRGIAEARVQLRAAYADLRARAPAEEFAERWRERLASWRFDPEVNELIRKHNEYYPIERRLPMDVRTRDYRLINGRSYRRPELDAAWAWAELPPG